jgi:predicted alpha/beta hydrolase
MENHKALTVFIVENRELTGWSKEMRNCFLGSGYSPDEAWARYVRSRTKVDDLLIEHYPQVYIKWTTMRRLLNR